jgi:glycosyltransferase involved in cell wall biosynthesis
MLEIVDYPWHQAHAYRLHALPARFWFAKIRKPLWNQAQRPIPSNFAGGIDESKIRTHNLHVALLHLDQWCDRDPFRAYPYRLMRERTRHLPQVVIMHGTPDDAQNRRRILRLIGDLPVVCNAHQAAQEWDGGEGRVDRHGQPQFRAVVHGYQVNEFSSFPLSQRRCEVFTVCSGGSQSREYHGLALVERLMRDVEPFLWYGPNGNRPWYSDYSDYRRMLASSLIYVSPTRRGPMPGSRTEAALAGCCIVSVPGQDWETYIEDGKTGFIVEDYRQARDVLRYLLAHPSEAYRIGQRGREMARSAFEHKRYAQDWLEMLAHIGVVA